MARAEVPAGEDQALLDLAAAGEASDELRGDPQFQVIETVARWARGWEQQDPDLYLGAYADDFRPSSGASRNAWETTRRQRILAPTSIRLTLLDLEVDIDGETATASFRQIYESDRFGDVVRKTLHLRRVGTLWKIVAEDAVAVRSEP